VERDDVLVKQHRQVYDGTLLTKFSTSYNPNGQAADLEDLFKRLVEEMKAGPLPDIIENEEDSTLALSPATKSKIAKIRANLGKYPAPIVTTPKAHLTPCGLSTMAPAFLAADTNLAMPAFLKAIKTYRGNLRGPQQQQPPKLLMIRSINLFSDAVYPEDPTFTMHGVHLTSAWVYSFVVKFMSYKA
jgi:hypothetical protein